MRFNWRFVLLLMCMIKLKNISFENGLFISVQIGRFVFFLDNFV